MSEQVSVPAPGSPKEKAVREEIRQMFIEITQKANSIGWDWELNARPSGGKQRMSVVITEPEKNS